METPSTTDEQRDALRAALESAPDTEVAGLVNAMHPAEVGDFLESVPTDQRRRLWALVEPESEGDVLLEVNEEVRATLLETMAADEVVAATEGMDLDDLAELVSELPDDLSDEVVRSMDQQDRDRLKDVLAYPEESAGRLMDPDTVTVRPDLTLDVVQRYLRMRGELPDGTDALFVVDREDAFLGVLSLARLVTADPSLSVDELMNREAESVTATTAAAEVARLFENHDLLSAPVVSDDGRLVGRITVDDVVDVIREEGEHTVLSMAGLDEEDDMFAPVLKSSTRRAVWLGVNLATAFLAASVVGLFQATLEEVVALAVLMPIVASMGGIAGTQTLTLMIRGLAVGQIQGSNARWLMTRELAVAVLNGLAWAFVVTAITQLWFGSWLLSGVIAVALAANLLIAALSGVAIPLVMRRMGIDPALAGGGVLTTVTDVMGFMTFLGLGALLLT